MKILDKSISVWQTGILLFILLFANKILVLPSLLYDGAKMNAFFIPIALFLLEFALLFVFYKVKKRFPNLSFIEILRQNCGKIVQRTVYVLFAVFFLCKAVLLYNVTFIFFRNMIYKDSGNFIFLFCFLPIINHMAICGLRTMGRTLQLFFPVISIIAIFCIIVGCFGVTNMPLLFDTGAFDIFQTALKHISCFGDVAILFLFMDKIEVKKGQWKIIFLFALAGAFLVTSVITLFLFSYNYTSFMHPYAIFEIMNYIKETAGLGRIDIISMVLIILFAYFHLSIYLKGFLLSFDGVFQKIDQIFGVLSFDFLFVIIVEFFIVNLETAVTYGQTILPFFEIIPFVILPLVCAWCYYRRRT